jgi:hypothetical protein
VLITANDVAAIAIVAGFGGVLATNYNQRAMARQQFMQDHQSEVYITVLRGARIRTIRVRDAYELAQGTTPPTPRLRKDGLLSDDETQFAAQLVAFRLPRGNRAVA